MSPKKYFTGFGIMVSFVISALVLFELDMERLSAAMSGDASKDRPILNTNIPFVCNIGQMESRVQYYASTFGGTVFITDSAKIYYSLLGSDPERGAAHLVIEESFSGGHIDRVLGHGQSMTRVSTFKGRNSEKWSQNIPTYQWIDLGEVYEGIDIKLRAHGNNLEKYFYIAPGSEPGDIVITIDGGNNLQKGKSGDLEVQSDLGIVHFSKPIAYQAKTQDADLWNADESEKDYVEVSYVIDGNQYGFSVGHYDPGRPLIIDPLLAATFLGGSGTDDNYEPSIALDTEGNVYVNSYTYSANFPTTPGVFDESDHAGLDCFVSKFSSDLTTLIASTFLGGNYHEYGSSIMLNSAGEVCLAGYTSSSDFPTTPGCFAPDAMGRREGFLAKLSSDLSSLIACTHIGGSESEGHTWPRTGLAEGLDGTIYMTGITRSADFPSPANGYDSSYNGGDGGGDIFIAKFSPDLTQLLATTFVGGMGTEWRPTIRSIENGDIYVIGETSSPDFPITSGAYQQEFRGSSDIFVARFNSDLSSLSRSTLLGGGLNEEALSIRLDSQNTVYLTGYTFSSDFPTTAGVYDRTFAGIRDIFVTKLNPDLTELIASTLIGGSSTDICRDMILDDAYDIYLTGNTVSYDFPVTQNVFDTRNDGGSPHGDAFVSKLSNDLTTLMASTFLGGTGDDVAERIQIDADGNVFIVGATTSTNLPTTVTAYDRDYNGGGDDCFIAKFDADLSEGTTSIEKSNDRPKAFEFGNYPNPFNPETTIRFAIKKPTDVSLNIYDTQGKLIRALSKQSYWPAGSHSLVWNGMDDNGAHVGSGVYLCTVATDDTYGSIKLLLVR